MGTCCSGCVAAGAHPAAAAASCCLPCGFNQIYINNAQNTRQQAVLSEYRETGVGGCKVGVNACGQGSHSGSCSQAAAWGSMPTGQRGIQQLQSSDCVGRHANDAQVRHALPQLVQQSGFSGFDSANLEQPKALQNQQHCCVIFAQAQPAVAVEREAGEGCGTAERSRQATEQVVAEVQVLKVCRAEACREETWRIEPHCDCIPCRAALSLASGT